MIRPAKPADVPTILRFIRELAVYEREPDAVLASEADLLRDGFGLAADGRTPLHLTAPRRFAALMAEYQASEPQDSEDTGPEPVGFALYFTSYSTWLGHHGLFLEDLYVTPSQRGRGFGRALLAELARIAVAQGCGRLEWNVLTWNEPAIAVYDRIGAINKSAWHTMRLSGDALERLASTVAEQGSDGAAAAPVPSRSRTQPLPYPR